MTNTYQVGDVVNVLNPIRLPKVEQVVRTGRIVRVSQSSAGEMLYRLDCQAVAASARVLRPVVEGALA